MNKQSMLIYKNGTRMLTIKSITNE